MSRLCTNGTETTRRGSLSLSYEESTSSEKRNVARNTVSVSLLIRLLTKIRTTRGVSWPLAICTATSEMLNTTPMNVIIAELIVVTIVLASWENAIRSPSSSYASSRWSSATIASSSSVAINHSTNTQTNPVVGANQNVSRRCSRRGDSGRGRR